VQKAFYQKQLFDFLCMHIANINTRNSSLDVLKALLSINSSIMFFRAAKVF